MKINKSERVKYIEYIMEVEGYGRIEATDMWVKMNKRGKYKIISAVTKLTPSAAPRSVQEPVNPFLP